MVINLSCQLSHRSVFSVFCPGNSCEGRPQVYMSERSAISGVSLPLSEFLVTSRVSSWGNRIGLVCVYVCNSALSWLNQIHWSLCVSPSWQKKDLQHGAREVRQRWGVFILYNFRLMTRGNQMNHVWKEKKHDSPTLHPTTTTSTTLAAQNLIHKWHSTSCCVLCLYGERCLEGGRGGGGAGCALLSSGTGVRRLHGDLIRLATSQQEAQRCSNDEVVILWLHPEMRRQD